VLSGIVGVWHLNGQPLDNQLLAAMGETLNHRGPDGAGCRIDGSVGFMHLHSWVTREEVGEQQPLVGRSGTMLVMDGRIDNQDELLSPLGLTSNVSDATCVLTAYERWGEQFSVRLNGDFALALFDPAAGRLLLTRDALGIRPLYYHRRNALFLFASEIKPLLKHPDVPVEPDDDGVADLLMVDARPLDASFVTCFREIRSLEAAHQLVVTRERTAVRRYWDFDVGA